MTSNQHLHPLQQFKYCPKCGSDQFLPHNAKANKCNSCGFIYYLNPSAAVSSFIFDGSGRLLVAVRAHEPAKGTYDLPGGFTDLYETAEQAICREIEEETGLSGVTPQYLFSIPNQYEYSQFTVHTMDLFYRFDFPEKEVEVKAADDVQELLWIPPQEVDPARFGLPSIKLAAERLREVINLK